MGTKTERSGDRVKTPRRAAPAAQSLPVAPPGEWGWTASQCRVLLALLVVLIVVLAIRYALNPHYISDPQPDFPSRYGELADRIDPDTADWPTLAALPAIGERRAKDIIAHRDAALAARPGTRVFHAPNDLLRIRGIGPAMVNAISPYLIFPPDDASPTQPATRP